MSVEQSAFVPDRSILDNAMIAFEVIHYLKNKRKGKKGEVALKIDMSKVYDRIDWNYLLLVLEKLGFNDTWVGWMRMCIESVSYSVIVNNETVGPIIPGRGLRQGDPLSPYLFILCAEGLTALIHQAVARGDLHGVDICRGAPTITHLLFADDCFLFFRSSIREMENMKNILKIYERASGQQINYQKSEVFFSKNVNQVDRDVIVQGLGVNLCLGTGLYLGLPSMIGRSKKAMFKFIKDRVWKKINSWGGRSLSRAGKEVMIKSVLQSIPTYFMSLFLLPSSLGDEIQSMISRFWWGGNANSRGGIHWLSWDKLCVAKDFGGLGFRNLYVFNVALLGKQGWRLMNNPGSLVARLYKAKYYPRSDFMQAPKGSNPSLIWRSIHEARLVLGTGCRWIIGDGSRISVFGDSWTADRRPILDSDSAHFNPFLRVADLFTPGAKSWNLDFIHHLFSPDVAGRIVNTPLFPIVEADRRVWWPETSGIYSVRSAYRLLMERVLEASHLHVEGSWRVLWKMKIPPKVKHFIWRLCRDVLPTRANLRTRHVEVEDSCPWCPGSSESPTHLFILCSKAKACWDKLGLLQVITDAAMTCIDFRDIFFLVLANLVGTDRVAWCMTLWSLWNCRNERIWDNKHTDANAIVWGGQKFFNEWYMARGGDDTRLPTSLVPSGPLLSDCWKKPQVGWVKCNVDASFSLVENKIGIGMCLRNDQGHFISARTHSFSPIIDVLLGETLGLYLAISWVRELGYKDVIFELDAKCVVDAFNSNKQLISEFGSHITACKDLFSFFNCNSHVEFARRNANKVAHSLAG